MEFSDKNTGVGCHPLFQRIFLTQRPNPCFLWLLPCRWLFISEPLWCPPWTESECESCSVVSDSLQPHGLCSPWNSPGQNTAVGSCSLLQGTFPTQGSNPVHQHCRWILYQLSQKGSPRILEWVAYPFSDKSSWPMSGMGVSCIAGGFFTNWTTREGLHEESMT